MIGLRAKVETVSRKAAAFLIRADARALPLKDRSVQCVVTSPPYWGLRDYGRRKQMGLEASPEAYVAALVAVFREVRRVLKDDGTVWLNLGDSYAGVGAQTGGTNSKEHGRREERMFKQRISWRKGRTVAHGAPSEMLRPGRGQNVPQTKNPSVTYPADAPHRSLWIPGLKSKDLCMIPARVALALQADGWYLRSDIIWSKPNPMPESVTDRPTKAYEHLFLLAKSESYYYDAAAIAEPTVHAGRVVRYDAEQKNKTAAKDPRMRTRLAHTMTVGETRNKRNVWTINTQCYKAAHFATMPEKLVEPCILAGSKRGDVCLDPFVGSGTVVAVAQRLGRRGVGVDLRYQNLAKIRTAVPLKPAVKRRAASSQRRLGSRDRIYGIGSSRSSRRAASSPPARRPIVK